MVQMRHLRDAALFTLPDLIKKKDISLPEKENQEEISSKDLYKLLYHSLSKEFDVTREQFLGFSRKEVEEALSPQFFVADFYRKYGNLLDQLCEQSPEVKEAWEWVNEEMKSPDTNANKIVLSSPHSLVDNKMQKIYIINLSIIIILNPHFIFYPHRQKDTTNLLCPSV